MAISNLISWLPFFTLMCVTVFLSSMPEKVLFLGTLWWGFTQSPITPILIYILSDRVRFVINGVSRQVAKSSLSKRMRRFTLTLTDDVKI